MTTPAHHPHGPSAIGNPCNAAWKAGLHAPALPASEDADDGTLLHGAVAWPFPETLVALDSEQRQTVERCLAQADAWTASINAIAPYVERRLDLWNTDGTLINFGTLDWIVLTQDGTRAILADWKMGRLASPLVADQLACYVAMAFQRWPALRTIEAWAWYPRVPALNQSWTYTRDELPGLVERINARIAVRIDPERWEFEPGDWCRYCKAQLICGARRRELVDLGRSQLGATLEALDGATAAGLLPVAKRAELLVKAIRDRAKDLAGAGQLPGYRLAEVRGREQLTGSHYMVTEALKAEGFGAGEIAACQVFDLAKIRETAKAAGLNLERLTPYLARVGG